AVTLTDGSIIGTGGVLTGTNYAVAKGSISAILAGNAGLTKTSSNTVTLSGVNTYTGVTAINEGVLSVASLADGGVASGIGAAVANASNLILAGGTLKYSGSSVAIDRAFTLSDATSSTIEVSTAGSNLTLNGAAASSSGAFIKSGAGTLTFNADNLYGGSTTVNAGSLVVTSTGSLGNSSSALIISSATLDLQRAITVGSLSMSGTAPAITNSTGTSSFEVTGTMRCWVMRWPTR
ncbi:MAG: autotransporter-associated beta strand repeat-containing protein, partial [Rhodoferax sp.]|nr:autotransporter-associated beta strand repeat-containing protein [Rhodoferax sp.]